MYQAENLKTVNYLNHDVYPNISFVYEHFDKLIFKRASVDKGNGFNVRWQA